MRCDLRQFFFYPCAEQFARRSLQWSFPRKDIDNSSWWTYRHRFLGAPKNWEYWLYDMCVLARVDACTVQTKETRGRSGTTSLRPMGAGVRQNLTDMTGGKGKANEIWPLLLHQDFLWFSRNKICFLVFLYVIWLRKLQKSLFVLTFKVLVAVTFSFCSLKVKKSSFRMLMSAKAVYANKNYYQGISRIWRRLFGTREG